MLIEAMAGPSSSTLPAIGAALLLGAGCAGPLESSVRVELDRTSVNLAVLDDDAEAPPLGPELEYYLTYAADRSPEVRAAFERWRAGVYRVSPSRRLPDPMVELGVFAWDSISGPTLRPARAAVKQEFPWPTQLYASADAASAEARALKSMFDAHCLELRERVADAYYRLWLIRRTRTIEREQLMILRGMSESALGQMATGAATLADQQQIDLTAARLNDAIAALDEQERAAQARLRAVVGAPADADTPTRDEVPALAIPSEPQDTLRASALEHPLIQSFARRGDAADAMAESQSAAGLPGFTVGLEWMRMPGPDGMSGLIPSVGIRLPLWRDSYSQSVRASQAEAAAQRADGKAAAQRAYAELEEALSMLRDARRRVELSQHTLLPQAQAAYTSVLGGYATSRSTVAASLLAQRDLLEIRLGLEQARAEHAVAWARLERIVGRSVERTKIPAGGRDG